MEEDKKKLLEILNDGNNSVFRVIEFYCIHKGKTGQQTNQFLNLLLLIPAQLNYCYEYSLRKLLEEFEIMKILSPTGNMFI